VSTYYGSMGSQVFKRGNTKLERFLPKNQHTQRKLLNFENWCRGVSNLTIKVNFLFQKSSDSFSIEVYQFRSTFFVIDIF
jgi:hypothetical protein